MGITEASESDGKVEANRLTVFRWQVYLQPLPNRTYVFQRIRLSTYCLQNLRAVTMDYAIAVIADDECLPPDVKHFLTPCCFFCNFFHTSGVKNLAF